MLDSCGVPSTPMVARIPLRASATICHKPSVVIVNHASIARWSSCGSYVGPNRNWSRLRPYDRALVPQFAGSEPQPSGDVHSDPLLEWRGPGSDRLRPMERPKTRYTSVGDVAYQIVGNCPFDLLYCVGLGSNCELIWDTRLNREYFSKLASFSRLIYFDRRGTGASDPIPNDVLPPWRTGAEDIEAVLDAAGSEQAALVGEAEAGAMAILFSSPILSGSGAWHC